MGRGGFEPPTHGFSVPAIENVNTSKTNTCEIEHSAADVNDDKSAHGNPELNAVIRAWDPLPEAVKRQIIDLIENH